MSAVTAWSYSRYADHARCPFYFKEKYITKSIKDEGSPAMTRGNDIHVGIAAYLKGTAQGVPRDALANPRAEQIITELAQIPHKLVEQQWGFSSYWTETGWFDRGNGPKVWWRVILDVGVVYPDMTGEALDWKTGKRYATNADQMELNALGMMCKIKPIKHVTSRMIYLDDTGNDIEDIDEFPATHKQRLIDKWTAKVAPMFNDQVFAPRPNDKCKWCPLARSKGGKCAFG
jgi:hypothetical protein